MCMHFLVWKLLLQLQFSAVLNAKKEKLRELKQRIEDLERKLRDEEVFKHFISFLKPPCIDK